MANGYCIGCGACAAFDPGIRIALDDYGRYQAGRSHERASVSAAAAGVCPFADDVPDEKELGRAVFGQNVAIDEHIGYHLANYAGWVIESDFRAKGSSGGLVSWLLAELLDRELVDYVVHVAPESSAASGQPLFRFTISATSAEVRARSKSRYYPVEMSAVIREMLQRPGRYAVVGIPCFIKAIRLACRESSVLKERIAFTIGVVCGQLKSTAYAEMFAWQSGILPADLTGIDFRTKLPDTPAHSYAVTVEGQRAGQQLTITKPMSELVGSNWGHGLFKYKACDFCDDVVGETADISIGDAWLPEYISDSAGTNVVVVRSAVINQLLTRAVAEHRLHLDSISAKKVVESQAGGFRHRRDGLAYRLFLEDQAGRWRPAKRVAPSDKGLTPKLREIYSLRYQMGQVSHEAFASARARGDFSVFVRAMQPLISRYDRYYRRPLLLRLFGKVKRLLFNLFRSKR